MQTEYPKLRQDLVTSEVKRGADVYYVVKDPITRRFFQFKEHEYFIAGRLDGKTSLEQIQESFQEKFGTSLSMQNLQQFVERIKALCLVETGLTAKEIGRSQRQASTEDRGIHRLLQFRLKAFDPDRFFNALMPHIKSLFTRQFVVLTSVLTLLAVGITVYRWGEYTAQARDLFKPDSIPTFVLVAMVVTILHEFAHGLTCKYYGGEVHEIGFLLIYLVPAFFCNVSDAWLFKDKGKRLWVSAAGTFFQVFIYAVAAIVWFFIDRETWLSGACAITIATAGLTALFNFNPLIKLDGYYLLSDYLGIPNLRKRAFDYLGSRATSWFRPGREPREVTPREKGIYLAYGLSAGAYSLGLLVFVVFKLGDFVLSVLR